MAVTFFIDSGGSDRVCGPPFSAVEFHSSTASTPSAGSTDEQHVHRLIGVTNPPAPRELGVRQARALSQ